MGFMVFMDDAPPWTVTARRGMLRRGRQAGVTPAQLLQIVPVPGYFALIFAQESRNVTVRLNTSAPADESGSIAK